jgi:hypothetical protein
MGPPIVDILRQGLSAQSGAAHELHLLDVPDMICKQSCGNEMRGGKHRFQVSKAKYDLLTSYFVPPEPSQGFNVIVPTLTPRRRKLMSLQGAPSRRARLQGQRGSGLFPAVVAQFVGRSCRRRARFVVNTGNGAEILVNGIEIVVRHVRECRPRHDLEEIAVYRIASRSGNANRCLTGIDLRQLRGCTSRMDVIEISAILHDLLKIRQGVTPFRFPGLVRGQIS